MSKSIFKGIGIGFFSCIGTYWYFKDNFPSIGKSRYALGFTVCMQEVARNPFLYTFS